VGEGGGQSAANDLHQHGFCRRRDGDVQSRHLDAS
jgi:hypothetical protein